MNNKVVIAAGGTGGHIYPALALAQKLKEKHGFDVVFIGTTYGMEKEIVLKYGYDLKYIKVRGFYGNIWSKLKAIALLNAGILQSLILLMKHKPRLVVGGGGYVSFPVILAAYILKIKRVLMEQNVSPGKVTRILARLSDKIFVSFPATEKYLKCKNIEVTGNPVREGFYGVDRLTAREKMNLLPDKFTVLITGASQGASSINSEILNALKLWKDYPWQVIHVTGKKHIENVKKVSENILTRGVIIDYRPVPYMEDIYLAYASSDLIIARAGATTIAEIIAVGTPSILIPYPYAAEKHQKLNAKFLEDIGGAFVLEDKELNKLPQKVIDFYKGDELSCMRLALGSLPKINAALKICEAIEELCRT